MSLSTERARGGEQATDEVWLSMASTTGEQTSYSTLATFTGVTAGDWSEVAATFEAPTADTVAAAELLDAGGAASVDGFDVQVNDGTAGARTSVRSWADPTGLGYASTARWGVVDLLEPVVASEPEPQPSRTTLSLTPPLVVGPMSTAADVRVTSDGDVADGLVQLVADGRAAGEAKPVGDDGRVRIPVPAPRTGIYLVQARFLGNDGAEASSSGYRVLVALRF